MIPLSHQNATGQSAPSLANPRYSRYDNRTNFCMQGEPNVRTIQLWQAATVLNRTTRGQNFGFHYSLNPYRGCSHGCRYCYARESHTYLGLNIREDFEQKLFAKQNLDQRLSAELTHIDQNRVIAIGTVTDPYQPLEGSQRLTRTAIQLLGQSGHVFTITTKSPLVERDLDLLGPLGQRRQVAIQVSVISLDRNLIKRLEPGAPPPRRRLETVRQLSEANIPVGVFVAPIVPGLCDGPDDLDALFSAIHAAGADWVMTSTTRLAPALRQYFFDEIARFDAKAALQLRRLYGPRQYVDFTYRRQLARLLDQLYRRYSLSQIPPVLRPHVTQEQLSFF